MRKIKVFLVSLLAMVLGLFCFVACGEGNIEGTYKFSSITMQNPMYDAENPVSGVEEYITVKVGEMFDPTGSGMGITFSADFMVVELKADGVLSVTSAMGGEPETMTGTWTQDGDKVTLTMTVEGEAESQEATVKGDTLVLDMDGMGSVTLKK
jgi:hypothetical protein